jgi:hypothetical protein
MCRTKNSKFPMVIAAVTAVCFLCWLSDVVMTTLAHVFHHSSFSDLVLPISRTKIHSGLRGSTGRTRFLHLHVGQNHGPGGGQGNYNDHSEADPCFASVMQGYEPVVDRIHQSAVESGEYKRMRHYVAIRTVRWLSRDEEERKINAIQRMSLT